MCGAARLALSTRQSIIAKDLRSVKIIENCVISWLRRKFVKVGHSKSPSITKKAGTRRVSKLSNANVQRMGAVPLLRQMVKCCF